MMPFCQCFARRVNPFLRINRSGLGVRQGDSRGFKAGDWRRAGTKQRGIKTERSYFPLRPSLRSIFFRLLPTFLTAFFTASADLRVFFAS